ncbi:hypothetical protein L810_1959 [Burkholderia sp. AU4i]|nr:hypothetical protein L810_1959 [Burkholderia sp. AU4i]
MQAAVGRTPDEIDEHERQRDAAAAALRQADPEREAGEEIEETVERRHRAACPHVAPRAPLKDAGDAGKRPWRDREGRANVRNDMAVRTATKENRQAAAEGQKKCAQPLRLRTLRIMASRIRKHHRTCLKGSRMMFPRDILRPAGG